MNFEQYQASMDPELRVGFSQMRARFRSLLGEKPPMRDLATHRQQMAEGIRAALRLLSADERVKSEDRRIPGPVGAPDVLVRVYRPSPQQEAMPAILWIHGGAFTDGRYDQDEATCQRIVEESGAVVVSVDYRLAPEHSFPAALDDCDAALRWMRASAAELLIERERIAVAGVSSGGCVAMALALKARDRKETPPAFVLLIYSALDDRLSTSSSHEIAPSEMIGNREEILEGWRAYLRNEQAGNVSPYAAPARATDLRGLPATYLMVGGLDLLRDENIEFAQRLLQAHVPTELHVYPGAFHGCERMVPTAEISQRATSEYIAVLRHSLHR
jgi:acetyl esterase/lipase